MSDQTVVRRRVAQHSISDSRYNDAKSQSQYQPYKDAAWGFINHWYPAMFRQLFCMHGRILAGLATSV